ncbi:head GIN domain-containing protein [Sphingopyxis sp.]|uniref:head GIN domain-containing protein n=1 Tax=Sphingopyxis sp. TaxID=1908224 RepID=UPI0035B3DAF2
MRNWTMAILPLAMALSGCNGDGKEGEHGAKQDDRAAPAGPVTTQSFDLKGFTGIKVAGPDDVTIRQGDAFAISARGPQRELDELEITLDGAMLSIGRKREGFSFSRHDSKGVEISITMPKLDTLRLTGSGSIDADNLAADAAKLEVTGSGDLKLGKLTAKSADLGVSGSGNIEIKGGTIDTGDFGVTGSGDIDAEGLAAQTLDISITGSGDVEAQATVRANVNILGSGDATIGGGGKCSTHAMGSGTATCK